MGDNKRLFQLAINVEMFLATNCSPPYGYLEDVGPEEMAEQIRTDIVQNGLLGWAYGHLKYAAEDEERSKEVRESAAVYCKRIEEENSLLEKEKATKKEDNQQLQEDNTRLNKKKYIR